MLGLGRCGQNSVKLANGSESSSAWTRKLHAGAGRVVSRCKIVRHATANMVVSLRRYRLDLPLGLSLVGEVETADNLAL